MSAGSSLCGSESELVDSLEHALIERGKRFPKCRLRVFREFDAGFGRVDLLSVLYSPNALTARHTRDSAKRQGESAFDRVAGFAMTYLQQRRWVSRSVLPDFLRVPRRRAERLLESLVDRGLVDIAGGLVKARPVTDVWAIRAIEAFEAKLAKWEEVAEQACRHHWFATRSYVVMPDPGRVVRERIVGACAEWQLGLWLFADRETSSLKIPAARRTPSTQIAWWINEFLFEEHCRAAV